MEGQRIDLAAGCWSGNGMGSSRTAVLLGRLGLGYNRLFEAGREEQMLCPGHMHPALAWRRATPTGRAGWQSGAASSELAASRWSRPIP
jgi:hypothetical protein